jgi:hypothetical protein
MVLSTSSIGKEPCSYCMSRNKSWGCSVQPEISEKKGHYVGSCLKILDMTGLKLSAFSRLKISTVIATVDDLNYPEKTDTYFIVNAPLIFSTCWKVRAT